MTEEEIEEMLLLMEQTANMLRGMAMDPSIPTHAKQALRARIAELDAMVEKFA
ncbi:hypothetical protein [Rhodoferax koreensis]|uniref:hypothetical protein n=1 Tax=Rhodoferax koreensis TaxID=1842727 RepID=UPI0012FFCFCB|nr:hypothetical protein [Rhodoferax koreense]